MDVQGKNKRNNVVVNADGRTLSLGEAAKIAGISYHTMKARVRRGNSAAELLSGVDLRGKAYEYKVGDCVFKTLEDVSVAFGMSVSGAYSRFRSDAFPDWVKIKL